MSIRRRLVATVCTLGLMMVACSSDDSESTASSLPSVAADTRVVPGERYLFEPGTHCGVGSLGLPVNGVFWLTDEAHGTTGDWMPPEWAATLKPSDYLIALEIVMSPDETELTATAGGRSVVYRPVTPEDPERLCA